MTFSEFCIQEETKRCIAMRVQITVHAGRPGSGLHATNHATWSFSPKFSNAARKEKVATLAREAFDKSMLELSVISKGVAKATSAEVQVWLGHFRNGAITYLKEASTSTNSLRWKDVANVAVAVFDATENTLPPPPQKPIELNGNGA